MGVTLRRADSGFFIVRSVTKLRSIASTMSGNAV